MSKPVKRVKSPIKWPGGKFYLAPKIISFIPNDVQFFFEGYCGGISVLLAKLQYGSEVIVDANKYITNFWTVLADKKLFQQFSRLAEATPFSDSIFKASLENYKSAKIRDKPDVQAALDFFILCRMSRQGLMKDYATPTSRLRRGINENVSAWLSSVDGLAEVHNRLKTVEVLTGSTLDYLFKYSNKNSLHYLDPPYMHATRVSRKDYQAFEISDRHHAVLLAGLMPSHEPLLTKKEFEAYAGNEQYSQYEEFSRKDFPGKFILSGYNNPLYEKYTEKFELRVEKIAVPNNASSAKIKEIKTECLWMNFGQEISSATRQESAEKVISKKIKRRILRKVKK
jgi:DNA adenine methylase